MRNKIGKLFVFAIFGFLVSTLSVHAMSYDITDPNSFGAMMNKYNETTQSVYVIGSYVFTTDHTLTTQDMMLSALSIDLSDYEGELIAPSNAYDKMTIFKLNRDYDEDDNPTGKWTIDTNFLGKDTLKDGKMVEVSYVDYEKAQSDSSLEVKTEASEQMKSDLAEYGYDIVLDNQEDIEAVPTPSDPKVIMLSGKVYKVENIENWAVEKQTGYYVAFEVVIPTEYQGKAQWWLDESNKLTHDGKNYAVVAISKEAEPQTFEVYVDFDGEGDEYEPTRYVFDYSGIEFAAQASEATLESETKDETVLGVLADALHLNSEDFVTIDENNNVTGDIHYNPDVTVDPEIDNKTDYYIPVIVTIDKKFAETATIVTKNNDKTKTTTFKKSADNNDKNIMAVIFPVADTDEDKTFTITIDLDGDGEEYEPKEYVYDYSKAKFLAKPEANVSAEGKTENKDTYANVMKDQFEYDGNQDTLTVTVENDNVKLTGQLVNEELAFNGKGQEKVDGYYFQYVIEISGDATNSSITIPTSPTTTKTIEYKDYDFQNVNGVSGIVVLHKLNKDSATNQFTVTVDYDGDKKADKTYTFDYTALHLDNNSEVLVTVSSESVEESDKTTFEDWGFPKEAYALTSVENNVVKGTLPYIENSKGFSGEEATGNFMVYTIELKDVNKEGKAEVKLSCTTGANCIDGWKIVKVNKGEDLSVMHRVKQNEDGSLKDIVAYVDLDGFANNDVEAASLTPEEKYLPYEIRLTFDKDIVLQKKSEGHAVVPENMEETTEKAIESSFSWKTPELQTAEVTYSENTIKITGNVARDTSVTGFGDGASGYYVPFALKFDKAYKDISIKMPYNNNPAKYENFDTETEIGALFQVYPNSPESTATITVDLDGDGNEYQPYDITIDYSAVKFLSNDVQFVKLEAAKTTSFENWMNEHKNFENFKLGTFEVTQEGTKVTITGTSTKNTNRDKQEQYWMAYLLELNKEYQDIEITKPNQQVENYASDAWDGDSHQLMTFTTDITESINGEKKPLEFIVDFDGSQKDVYLPVTYTIDWSGVTAATE